MKSYEQLDIIHIISPLFNQVELNIGAKLADQNNPSTSKEMSSSNSFTNLSDRQVPSGDSWQQKQHAQLSLGLDNRVCEEKRAFAELGNTIGTNTG